MYDTVSTVFLSIFAVILIVVTIGGNLLVSDLYVIKCLCFCSDMSFRSDNLYVAVCSLGSNVSNFYHT